jgi:hypothetical protein
MRSRAGGLWVRLEASKISQTAAAPKRMKQKPKTALRGVGIMISPQRERSSILNLRQTVGYRL